MNKRIRLGDLLLDMQLITSDQLSIALKEQKKSGLKLVVGSNAPIGDGDKPGLITDICPNNTEKNNVTI